MHSKAVSLPRVTSTTHTPPRLSASASSHAFDSVNPPRAIATIPPSLMRWATSLKERCPKICPMMRETIVDGTERGRYREMMDASSRWACTSSHVGSASTSPDAVVANPPRMLPSRSDAPKSHPRS